VFFLDSGVASVVADGQRPIELAMIGHEGMTGVTLALGDDDRVPYETYMQIAGNGRRLLATKLREAVAASASLQCELLRGVYDFLEQTIATALANGRNNIEERLARWLLTAHDRIDGDELVITHESLSVMLGVRRSGVTMALQELDRRGLIAHQRGSVSVLDREGLEEASNGGYAPFRHN
jgi:CRP-like cAMP-binding protein